MSVPIECRLRPSRLGQGLLWLPLVALAVLAVAAGVPLVWVAPLAGVIGVSLWRLRLGQGDWGYLRWQGSHLTLYRGASQTNAETYDWLGRGRRNAWYLRLDLHDQYAGRYDLVIWRDSVTDASWRALNACYRVQATLLEETEH